MERQKNPSFDLKSNVQTNRNGADSKVNGSWSSADSVQQFPERDTSRQVSQVLVLIYCSTYIYSTIT